MKTLDLRQESMTLEQLLQFAKTEAVLILSDNGNQYILENADNFEQEVIALGNSKKFMNFLAERSQEQGYISLDDIEPTFRTSFCIIVCNILLQYQCLLFSKIGTSLYPKKYNIFVLHFEVSNVLPKNLHHKISSCLGVF
jgi:hypothetical protein